MLELRNTLTGQPADRLPNVDVHEENGEIVLTTEVRGLVMGEVEVSIDHGDLVMEGDGWDGREAGREHYEHLAGRLALPFEAGSARVVRRVEADVIEVRIPFPPISLPGEGLVPEEIAY